MAKLTIPTIRLSQAAMMGDVDMVECLLQRRFFRRPSPDALNHQALRLAAEHGHTKCVKLLIPYCAVIQDRNDALIAAAKNGHIQCVELLLPVSNPKARNSEALCWAVSAKKSPLVELLWPHSDPQKALELLKGGTIDAPKNATEYLMYYQAIHQAKSLHGSLSKPMFLSRPIRKM